MTDDRMKKKKISIAISPDVLAGVDRLAGSKHSRSAVIERILRRYLRARARGLGKTSDLEFINSAADHLNLEAAEVLNYQSACTKLT